MSLLGCGRATTVKMFEDGKKRTCTYFCCRYKNAGNIGNEFKNNVAKGSFSKAETCDRLSEIVDDAVNQKIQLHVDKVEKEEKLELLPITEGKSHVKYH